MDMDTGVRDTDMVTGVHGNVVAFSRPIMILPAGRKTTDLVWDEWGEMGGIPGSF